MMCGNNLAKHNIQPTDGIPSKAYLHLGRKFLSTKKKGEETWSLDLVSAWPMGDEWSDLF